MPACQIDVREIAAKQILSLGLAYLDFTTDYKFTKMGFGFQNGIKHVLLQVELLRFSVLHVYILFEKCRGTMFCSPFKYDIFRREHFKGTNIIERVPLHAEL